jgi:hypothetical protein
MKSSSRLGRNWVEVGEALGVEVVTPYAVALPSGNTVNAAALVRLFGSPKGMLIVSNYDVVRLHLQELEQAGYGFSVLDEPSEGTPLVLQEYVDILSDWGWLGRKTDAPWWLRKE